MIPDSLMSKRLSRATPAQQSLHNNFVESLNTVKRGLLRAAFYLAMIADRKVHRALGFQTIIDYAVASTSLTPRQARELVRMGRNLEHLPQIAAAIEDGSLSWGKARLIVSSATSDTEKDLLDLARSHGKRALDEALKQRRENRSGSGTSSPQSEIPTSAEAGPAQSESARSADSRSRHESRPRIAPGTSFRTSTEPRPIHVNLAFTPEEYARWEAAIASWPRRRGESLAALHLDALTRPPHRAPDPSTEVPGTLLVILECPTCRQAKIPTSRGERPAPRALLAATHCDAIVEQEQDGHVTRRQTIPPQLRRQVLRRDRYRCQARSCGHARHLEVHHRVPAAQGGRTELNNLVTLCRRCHRRLHAQEQDTQRAVALGQDLP
jgi:hypothetical protein